jgi:biotin carboxyl carrier protein
VSAQIPLELLLQTADDSAQLLSPGVGWFCGALEQGSVLSGGQFAGELITLNQRHRLLVPAGVHGVVRSKPPTQLRAPVAYGELLYELGALAAGEFAAGAVATDDAHGDTELSLRCLQAGRFYHRSAPGEASLCEVGRELEVGTPIGLIEVMKTFTQVVYRAERSLPARARIVRVVARDGGDVDEGDVLVVVAAR